MQNKVSQVLQDIRNLVQFEHFTDISVPLEGVSEVERAFVFSEVMRSIHLTIVRGSRLALAFPRHDGKSLGNVVRAFGTAEDVTTLLGAPEIKGLKASRVIQVTEPAVPPETSSGIQYKRASPEKLTAGSLRRLEERGRRRRKAGTTKMEEADIVGRTKVLKSRRTSDALPAKVELKSSSSRQLFPLYIEAAETDVSGLRFNSYGLSDGNGAVPFF